MKIPTRLFKQEDFCQLTLEERGVLITALLESTDDAQAPGYLNDRITGRAWSIQHIIDRFTPRVPAAQIPHEQRAIAAGMETFVQRELFTFEEGLGYAVDSELLAQFLNENNLVAKRAYDRDRQMVRRRRQKAEAEAKQPVPIRRVEDA